MKDLEARVPEPFITTTEAAAFLGVKVSWLHANTERLHLPYYRVGRTWRWRRSDLAAWAETKRAA